MLSSTSSEGVAAGSLSSYFNVISRVKILATTRTFCTRLSIRSRYLVVSLNKVLPVEIREWEGLS
jgi:hypothetical protein